MLHLLARTAGRSARRLTALPLLCLVVWLISAEPARTQPFRFTATGGPNLGQAAQLDFSGGTDWLNTGKAITAADLKGRVVLVDFWTLCCINCIHVLPDLAKLEAKYPGVLVVVGCHTPKFENEKNSASIRKAIMRYQIKHPVINDADLKLWRRYGIESWPSFILFDPDGNYYGRIAGEANYDILDQNIAKLVKLYKRKGTLKATPLDFKLVTEKIDSPLYFPGKVLADGKGKRLFIADSTNHRIVITDLTGKKIAVVGEGVEGFKDGPFNKARFSDPQGMALVGEKLYVADRKNHSIRAVDLAKDHAVHTVAGNGKQNHFDRATAGNGINISLNSPWDLLFNDGKLYIAMAGHHQVWTYVPASGRVAPFAGNGREEIVDGPLKFSSFAQPSGLATDGQILYVADSETSSIRAVPFNPAGRVTTVVGQGLFAFGDVEGVGPKVRLQHALGVAFHAGELYVADTYNSKIKLIDPAKQSCTTFLGDPPGWLKAKMFNEPGGVSIAGNKLYIADTNNHRIQIADLTTKDVTTLQLQGVEPVRHERLAKNPPSTGDKK